MRKFSFLIALSVLFTFVSCSEFGDLFGSQSGKLPIKIHLEQSRANDTSFERGDEVGLYVVNYDGANAGTLATSGNHVDNLRYTLLSDWTPDTDVYWLDESTKADFYAYYPYGYPSDVYAHHFEVMTDQSTEENYWASDFMWNSTHNVSPSINAIALTMEHIFSNALIYVEAGENFTAEQLAAANVEVSLCNVKTAATIDLTTGVATATGSATNIAPWYTGTYYRAMVVPQTVSGDVTLVTVTINGTKYTHATDITFKAGTQHRITITVSAYEDSDTPSNGLSVNFSIKEWNLDSEDYGGEGVVEGSDSTPGGDAGETPVPTVLEFFADTTMDNGEFQYGMSLIDAIGFPGHMFYATSANGDFVSMILLDYDFQSYGCESYSYLTAHETVYPLVAGSVNEGNLPSVSCVLVDPGYTNFYIGEKSYYPVVPESETDADGNPYGVWVFTLCGDGQDLNMLSFYLPAVDDKGNPAVIQGSYTGPLGYELTNNTTIVYPFNLNDWGFTEFTATQNGDILTLKGQSVNGNLILKLNLAQNNGEVEGTWMALEDGTGSLTGYFFDSLDGEFPITSGQFTLTATETPGQYTLTPSPRNPVLFVGPHTKELDSSVDYTITIEGLTRQYTIIIIRLFKAIASQ